MKIQNLETFNQDRKLKLVRSSMIYLVLFAVGIVVYVNGNATNGITTIIDKVLGTYTAQGEDLSEAQIVKELNKFDTLVTEDDANLASCGTYVKNTNYNSLNGNVSTACTSDDCKQKAQYAGVSGWMKLYYCDSRPNKNLGCNSAGQTYTGAIVDTLGVYNFPVLDFLADTDVKVAENQDANDPFSFTQPFCFYDIFRSFSDATKEINPLNFSSQYEGAIYFNSTSKVAPIKYKKLGTGAQCWGINWDNFDYTANFNVKAFYNSYWNTKDDKLKNSQPDTWWAYILNFYKALFGKSIKDSQKTDVVSVKSVTGNDEVCENLPGGAITKLNESKPVSENKKYEITRKIYEFSEAEICDMYLENNVNLKGVNYCTILGDKNLVINKSTYSSTDLSIYRDLLTCVINPKTKIETCSCKDEYSVNICGNSWTCSSTFKQIYDSSKNTPSCITVGGSDIKYKVTGEPFPNVNIPNAKRLLEYVRDFDVIWGPYMVKYGENIGIKIDVERALLDANSCGNNCTYGQNLEYRHDELTIDAVKNLDTSIKSYINVNKNYPYSVNYNGGNELSPLDASENNVSRVYLYYFYPYLGNVPQMLERLSTYLSNQANEDTGQTLVQWLFNKLPIPQFRNVNLKNIRLNLCENETVMTNDCFDPNMSYIKNVQKQSSITDIKGLGIDISHWDGYIKDWNLVKNDPHQVQFVISKASDGLNLNSPDSQFANNWAGSGSVGLKRGAYHYFIGDVDGTSQCNFFLTTVESQGLTPGTVEIPLAIDVEEQNNEGIDPVTFTSNLTDMVNCMRSAGYTPMIYTRANNWAVQTTVPEWSNDDIYLWIAAWHDPGEDPNAYDPGPLPPNWTKWTIWQYSGDCPTCNKLYIDGIDSIVDGNVANPNMEDVVSIADNKQKVLGVDNTRANSIDSLGTYLNANIYKKNNAQLFELEDIRTVGDNSNPNPNVTYFPPEPTDPDSPPVSPPNITPIYVEGECPFVGSDKSTAITKCLQGPLGDYTHGCSKNKYYFAIDLSEYGYGVAPEPGIVHYYSQDSDDDSGCVTCGGLCMSTVKLYGNSGKVYVYVHMLPYGATDGENVEAGRIIGVTMSGESRCSDGTHLDFSVMINGARTLDIINIYNQLCNESITCTNDNKCSY